MARLSERRDQKQSRLSTSVVDHQSTTDKTLANYLDAMLHDVTTRLEGVEELPESLPAEDQTRSESIPEPDLPAAAPLLPEKSTELRQTEPPLQSPVAVPEFRKVVVPEAQPTSTVTTESMGEVAVETQDIWLENGRPAWAQERFDCLMFVVDGLRLAVPLLLLGNIHPLDRPLTPLFDQPKWFLGLLSLAQERTIRVVDTAKLVMPERYRPESAKDLGYAVGVHDSDWAFGCHQIEGSISLTPEQVKWRTSRTSRPWLAGTVVDEMCALVDLHAFSRTLETGQRR